MNDIKARIKSVQSTMQITKAMELVATSKLRRAKENAEKTRPFYRILAKAINSLKNSSELQDSLFLPKGAKEKTLFLVLAGDRGLAGGYNTNIFKLTEYLAGESESLFLPIGKKACEFFERKNREIHTSVLSIGDFGVSCAQSLAKKICEGYFSGEFNKVVIVYTRFVSMITQTSLYEQLLPFEFDGGSDLQYDPIIEEEPEELIKKVLPQYLGGVIYAAACEATASECAARRSAMNAANKNASEMIDSLMLKYNRARQSVITQEITEIISGAEAL